MGQQRSFVNCQIVNLIMQRSSSGSGITRSFREVILKLSLSGVKVYLFQKIYDPLIEFFLNVFSLNSLNSVTKIFVIKRTRTCHLLCKRPGCDHSASKTHVRDRIFKLTLIHASVIIRFPEFNESSAPFRKKSKGVITNETIIIFKHYNIKIRLIPNECLSGLSAGNAKTRILIAPRTTQGTVRR